MLEKKYLKMNSVLTLEHEDVVAYAALVASGNYPNNIPQTTAMDVMKKELKANVDILEDGRVLIYDFYAVGEEDYLVFSRLGISVLTRSELAVVIKE